MNMIEITSNPIDLHKILESVKADNCGAVSLFLGTVRNHSKGKEVDALEYEAYPEMAEKMINKIVDEVKSKWDVRKIAVSHRTGRLEVGDISVAMAVSSPHRKDSFPACRYLIDRLKEIVPIWKKEYGVDGSTWVESHS